MQQENQELSTFKANEIDLSKYIWHIFQRKLLIFCITTIITLISIAYALNISPSYSSSVSFTFPSDNTIYELNQKFQRNNQFQVDSASFDNNNFYYTKKSLFANYLNILSTQTFQKQVFIDPIVCE